MSFISFYFGCLDSKPNLNDKKRLFIKIELSDGKTKSTEISNYNGKENIVVFSESFDFDYPTVADIPYFLLSICEPLQDEKVEVLAKKTIHLYKDMPDKQELKLETKNGTILNLFYTIEISDNMREKLVDPQIDKPKTPVFSEIINETNLKELDLLSLGPLFKNFVESVGPLVDMKQLVQDFFTWKKTKETLIFGIAATLFISYHRLTLFFALLIFFRYSQQILSIIMKKKIKNPEKHILVYKRNLIFIKNIMELSVSMYNYYQKVIDPNDKSTLFNLLSLIKRFSLASAILLLLFDATQLIILIFWTTLLYQTNQGMHMVKIFSGKAMEFIDLFNDLVQENVKLGKILPLAKRTSSIQEDFTKKNVKTFYLYENQRWWLGKGWCDQMLLGERPQWSDELGKAAITKDFFQIPNSSWNWENDWAPDVTNETDNEGWEYAADFKSPFKPKPNSFSYVRRRKWFRICYQAI